MDRYSIKNGQITKYSRHTSSSLRCPTDNTPICRRSSPLRRNNVLPFTLFFTKRSAYWSKSFDNVLRTQSA